MLKILGKQVRDIIEYLKTENVNLRIAREIIFR